MLTRSVWTWIALLAGVPVLVAAEPPAEAPPPKAEPPQAPLRALEVFPPEVNLDGPRDEQRLAVLGEYADGRRWDLSREAGFTTGSPDVARVEAGVVRPVGDGETAITVQAGGQSVVVPVRVRRATADLPVSFSREVVPVLTKAGCNQGACHGSQHGRGGFKLSLLGFDPTFDYPQIVHSAEGRRVVVSDPERSIFLLKPALVMEHGGGERFKPNGREYNLLRQWLEDGAPAPRADDPTVTALEVWPAKRVLVPGEQQQIVVRATWSDGRREDVTANAQFDSLNDAVASVSPAGLITAKNRGETHIMVRFGGQAAVAQVTLPYARLDPYPEVPTHNFIDEKLIAKWKDLGLTPSPECSDAEFFRRIHLDAIGTLPSPEDIRAFLADPSPEKRRRAIDRVLDRPEYVDFWAYKWGDLLRINRDLIQDKGMWSFHNWVRACLRDNKPVDEMVRDIITAEGSTFTEGPANYYRIAREPADWAETTAQLFLGVRVQCAKCHHHPFEKWSQDDYYGLTAFFVRLGTKNSQEFGLFGRETVVYLRPTGEQTHPRKGGVVKPRPLDGPVMDDPFDRRRKLAEWITAKDNPYFARNMVNRFWGYLMGRGLVEPLDDLRATNPASNPELLDALARDFVEHNFDLKHLLRTIMNSRAYQLSAAATDGNRADTGNIHYTRYTVRRLTAEQLADAIDFATGTREKYQGLPLGTRAIQMPDTKVRSYLMDVFGRPARQITCECERTMQPNIAQALHLLNGDFLNRKIAAADGRVETLLKAGKPLPEVIEELYLVTLSRPPSPEELAKEQQWIAQAPSVKEGVQDLLWVLLNRSEFLFNH
ncbi:MAG TPA: DUF1549 and DUF1553 domain-containing protein [Gemmataceae bacterium]|nr:DUF1549 and DUF1553 domain-containing protein [Gemmataceae bacterium]